MIDDRIAELSRSLLSQLTTSAFGDIAGPLVDIELGDWLGLGDADGLSQYLDKISAQLAQMQSELIQLQTGVNAILAGVTAIEEQIEDAELQAALENFTIASTNITEVFTSYCDIVSALAGSDPVAQQQAATDLFDLLGSDSARAIATSMTVVQEFFDPSLSEMKGLIEYQSDVLSGAAFAYASNSDNFKTSPPSNPNYQIPNSGYWNSSQILTEGQAVVATTIDSTVLETLTAFVTVQAQGLALLNTAWLHSLFEPQIESQVNAINRVTGAMATWSATVPGTVDVAIASNLQQFGKTMINWVDDSVQWDFGNGDIRTGNPLDASWLMWQRSPSGYDDQYVQIAQEPWNYGGLNTMSMSTYNDPNYPQRIDVNALESNPSVTANRFSLPPKITAFLAALASPTPSPQG